MWELTGQVAGIDVSDIGDFPDLITRARALVTQHLNPKSAACAILLLRNATPPFLCIGGDGVSLNILPL